jgi:anti-sigma factor RsiW
MDCARFLDSYSDFADGLLDERAEIELFQHMAECPACQRLHAAYVAGCGALRRLHDVRPAPDFGSRLTARLQREESGTPVAGPAALLAGLLLVAGAAGTGWWLIGPRTDLPMIATSAPRAIQHHSPLVVHFAGDSSLRYPEHFTVIPVSRDLQASSPGQAPVEVTVDWMHP